MYHEGKYIIHIYVSSHYCDLVNYMCELGTTNTNGELCLA